MPRGMVYGKAFNRPVAPQSQQSATFCIDLVGAPNSCVTAGGEGQLVQAACLSHCESNQCTARPHRGCVMAHCQISWPLAEKQLPGPAEQEKPWAEGFGCGNSRSYLLQGLSQWPWLKHTLCKYHSCSGTPLSWWGPSLSCRCSPAQMVWT